MSFGDIFGINFGRSGGGVSHYPLTTPIKFYAVTNKQFQLNLANLTGDIDAIGANWEITGLGSGSKLLKNKVIHATPLISDTDNNIIINQYTLNGVLKNSVSGVYHCVDSAQAGTLAVLVIGDSTIAGNNVVDSIEASSVADGVLTLSWIGTKGTANKHEGIGGWTIDTFYTDATSPFYNAAGFTAGYDSYCMTNGVPNVVIIKLGINDFWSYETDTACQVKINTTLVKLQGMITGIFAKNPETFIGIDLVGGPSNQDKIGNDYGLKRAWRVRRNFQMWNATLLNTSFNSKVTILSGNIAIDIVNYTNGLHPNSTGYVEIANHYYAWLKYVAYTIANASIPYIGWVDSTYNWATLHSTQTYGDQVGDIITQDYSGTSFNGIGLVYTASEKRRYKITIRLARLEGCTAQHGYGILLWNGATAVTYNLPPGSEGGLTSFLGNFNYKSSGFVADGTYHTVTFTVDLSLAPDFTKISIHSYGYIAQEVVGTPVNAVDLSLCSVVPM